MASGTVYVDASLKDSRGNVVVFGRALVGHNGVILPRDLGLSYIKTINLTPWHASPRIMVAGSIGSQATKDYRRSFAVVSGSIGSLGVFDTSAGSTAPTGNYARIRSYRVETLGSITARVAGAQGTARLYIGTQAGSVRYSFNAVGR